VDQSIRSHYQLHRWPTEHRTCLTELHVASAIALYFRPALPYITPSPRPLDTNSGYYASNKPHRHHQQLVELPFSTTVFWQGVNEYSISFLQDLLHEVISSNAIVSSIAASRTWRRIVLRCNRVGVFLRLLGRVVLMVGLLLLSVQPQSVGSRVTHRGVWRNLGL
jgi:hypothetical protein